MAFLKLKISSEELSKPIFADWRQTLQTFSAQSGLDAKDA